MLPDKERPVYKLERVLPADQRVRSALLRGVYLERNSRVMPPAARELFTASELTAFLLEPENVGLSFKVTTVSEE